MNDPRWTKSRTNSRAPSRQIPKTKNADAEQQTVLSNNEAPKCRGSRAGISDSRCADNLIGTGRPMWTWSKTAINGANLAWLLSNNEEPECKRFETESGKSGCGELLDDRKKPKCKRSGANMARPRLAKLLSKRIKPNFT